MALRVQRQGGAKHFFFCQGNTRFIWLQLEKERKKKQKTKKNRKCQPWGGFKSAAPLSVPNPDTDLRDRGCAQLRGNFFTLQFFSDKDPSCLHNPFYFTPRISSYSLMNSVEFGR